jgi:hypothetical protein
LRGEIVPPVVVAEDGMHAERRPELAEDSGPLLGRHLARLELVARRKIAEQHDDVGGERVGLVDDGFDAVERHGGPARVHVGDDADREVEAAGPIRRRDGMARNLEPPARLHGKAIARKPHHAGAGEAGGLQELTTGDSLQRPSVPQTIDVPLHPADPFLAATRVQMLGEGKRIQAPIVVL